MNLVSPLLATKLERDAWKETEKLSRAFREKKVHAYAVKKVRELGATMVEIAKDEISGDDGDSDSDKETGEDEEGFQL
jgi:hypothetical protein